MDREFREADLAISSMYLSDEEDPFLKDRFLETDDFEIQAEESEKEVSLDIFSFFI